MQNFEDMLIDMPVIASPPAELVNLVNELIDVGEPRMANDQGVQPLVQQAALLEEQARQAQVEEDAALGDLLQDEFIDEDTAEDSGFETDFEEEEEEVQVENELMDGVEEQVIDSDAETVDNNPPEPMQDSDNVVDDDSDLDMSEVTLRRTMRVPIGFFAVYSIYCGCNAVRRCVICVGDCDIFNAVYDAAKTDLMMYLVGIATCVSAARSDFGASRIGAGFVVYFAGSGCAWTAT